MTAGAGTGSRSAARLTCGSAVPGSAPDPGVGTAWPEAIMTRCPGSFAVGVRSAARGEDAAGTFGAASPRGAPGPGAAGAGPVAAVAAAGGPPGGPPGGRTTESTAPGVDGG